MSAVAGIWIGHFWISFSVAGNAWDQRALSVASCGFKHLAYSSTGLDSLQRFGTSIVLAHDNKEYNVYPCSHWCGVQCFTDRHKHAQRFQQWSSCGQEFLGKRLHEKKEEQLGCWSILKAFESYLSYPFNYLFMIFSSCCEWFLFEWMIWWWMRVQS